METLRQSCFTSSGPHGHVLFKPHCLFWTDLLTSKLVPSGTCVPLSQSEFSKANLTSASLLKSSSSPQCLWDQAPAPQHRAQGPPTCLSASCLIHSALCPATSSGHSAKCTFSATSLPPLTPLPSGELLLILGDLAHPDVSRSRIHSHAQLRALMALCLGP